MHGVCQDGGEGSREGHRQGLRQGLGQGLRQGQLSAARTKARAKARASGRARTRPLEEGGRGEEGGRAGGEENSHEEGEEVDCEEDEEKCQVEDQEEGTQTTGKEGEGSKTIGGNSEVGDGAQEGAGGDENGEPAGLERAGGNLPKCILEERELGDSDSGRRLMSVQEYLPFGGEADERIILNLGVGPPRAGNSGGPKRRKPKKKKTDQLGAASPHGGKGNLIAASCLAVTETTASVDSPPAPALVGVTPSSTLVCDSGYPVNHSLNHSTQVQADSVRTTPGSSSPYQSSLDMLHHSGSSLTSSTRSKKKHKKAEQEKARQASAASQASATRHAEWLRATRKVLDDLPDDPFASCYDSPGKPCLGQSVGRATSPITYHSVMEKAELDEEDLRASIREEIIKEFNEDRILAYSREYIAQVAREQAAWNLNMFNATEEYEVGKITNPLALLIDELSLILDVEELAKLTPIPGASLRGAKAVIRETCREIEEIKIMLKTKVVEDKRIKSLQLLRARIASTKKLFPLGEVLRGQLEEVWHVLFELEEESESYAVECSGDVLEERLSVDCWSLY